MAAEQLVLLATIGVVAGFINLMAGGGSLLTVPTLVLMGMPGPVANGTNRIATLVENISAVLAFYRRGWSDFRLSITLALCSLPGAVAGALLGSQLDGEAFEGTLAVIMLGVILMMALDRPPSAPATGGGLKPAQTARPVLGHALMVVVGFYGGFIQLGVGFIIMPVLHRVLGMDLIRVNMHKVFIIASYTLVALIVYAAQVNIEWLIGGVLAISYAVGAWLAVHTSLRQGEAIIRPVFYLALAILIIRLLIF